MNIDEAIQNLNNAVMLLEEALAPKEERWTVAACEDGWYGKGDRFLAVDQDKFVYMALYSGSNASCIAVMSKEEAITIARVLGHRAVRVDDNFTIVDEVDV